MIFIIKQACIWGQILRSWFMHHLRLAHPQCGTIRMNTVNYVISSCPKYHFWCLFLGVLSVVTTLWTTRTSRWVSTDTRWQRRATVTRRRPVPTAPTAAGPTVYSGTTTTNCSWKTPAKKSSLSDSKTVLAWNVILPNGVFFKNSDVTPKRPACALISGWDHWFHYSSTIFARVFPFHVVYTIRQAEKTVGL